MSFIFLVILGLATWRVSSLFVNEQGPFNMFVKIRELAGIQHYPEDFSIVQIPDRLFAQILSCVWCMSMYVGIFWTILYFVHPGLALGLSLPFALSAMGILINMVVEKLKTL
jgi:hypothetical protein